MDLGKSTLPSPWEDLLTPPQAQQITLIKVKSPSKPMKGNHWLNKLATAYTLVISKGVDIHDGC